MVMVVLTIISVFCLAIVASICISIIIFSLRFSGAWYVAGFGSNSLLPLIMVFPWVWLLATAATILGIDYLMRRFRFVYRKNILFVSGLVSVVILGIGLGLERSRVHDKMVQGNKRMRHMSPLYGDVDAFPKQGILVGRVVEIGSDTAVLETRSDKELTIEIPPHALAQFGTFSIGDVIVTVGRWEGGTYSAIGVRKTFTNFPGLNPRSGRQKVDFIKEK